MDVTIYKSLWGMTGSLSDQFKLIAEAGYDGVESAAAEIRDIGKFKSLLSECGLDYMPLIYTEGSDVNAHLEDFRRLVVLASEFSPKKMVAHAGRDLWHLNDQLRFFDHVLKIENEFGIPIAHETHRRRPLFSPMNTVTILNEFPELKVNADLSHWCCVTESMLEDHSEVIKLAASRTIHIHARVGYENGPQVSDPRAPEWAGHLAKFESWWKLMLRDGMTVTPEYGPPTYMQTMPNTNEPVADLWEVCLWGKNRFQELVDS
ncbi:MAG TPA: TIM barrel protein [Candidatus Kapabacteria bacterium]|nr:TIM barrel protein [Candidatus Kapabacteria bacterium]